MSDAQPNILLILNDDMGFSDIGCYGGEVRTPHLDMLAADGLRYTQFYNTARCCPSRASLLTGLHPHQAQVGHMMRDDGVDGYRGDLGSDTVTIAEALKQGGYATYMSGKWHVTRHIDGPRHSWPVQRGFEDVYGLIHGCASYYHPGTLVRGNDPIEPEGKGYYITDAISDEAVRQIQGHANRRGDQPFFQYVAYTAPHWPLHAPEEDVAKYRGRFDAGWDELRRQRRDRMVDMGLIDADWSLSERDPDVGPWKDEPNKAWQARRMEVYAAQIDRMDQGIGRIVQALRDTAMLDNTLIVFLADNGGCAEVLGDNGSNWVAKKAATATTWDGDPVRFGNSPDIVPGPENSYSSYGVAWANLSNTPFRYYKHFVHEGGIATPFIVHWPAGIQAQGELRHQPAQLPDLLATFLDLAGVAYPERYDDHAVRPLEGFSMVPTFADQPHNRETLFWEHEGNCAVRSGQWKLVRRYPGDWNIIGDDLGKWELYDLKTDRAETRNLAERHPDLVRELAGRYDRWAERCGVRPWTEILANRHAHKRPAAQ